MRENCLGALNAILARPRKHAVCWSTRDFGPPGNGSDAAALLLTVHLLRRDGSQVGTLFKWLIRNRDIVKLHSHVISRQGSARSIGSSWITVDDLFNGSNSSIVDVSFSHNVGGETDNCTQFNSLFDNPCIHQSQHQGCEQMHNKELVRLCIGGSNINSVLEILLTTKSAMVSDQGQFWMSVWHDTTKRRTDTCALPPVVKKARLRLAIKEQM